MLLSTACQLALGLLSFCIFAVDARPSQLSKRDNNVNVLNGANFPDPSILAVDGTYYVFGTADGAGHDVPLTSNSDFNNAGGWSAVSDAFPSDGVPAMGGGGWATPGSIWAPDANQLTDGDGSFALYYSAALQSNGGVHCIGLARSTTVAGPYNDSSSGPWICPEDEGGAIDAAGFLDDDNSRYVVYKIDGPAAHGGGYCDSPSKGQPMNTSLMLQQVQSDGYTMISSPAVLYDNQGLSDSYNIEAPGIVKRDNVYFLVFSSGCTNADSYTLNYATSTAGVWGPYGPRQVLVQTGDFGEFGPGSADIASNGGQLVYHSNFESDNPATRWLNTADVSLNGQTMSVAS